MFFINLVYVGKRFKERGLIEIKIVYIFLVYSVVEKIIVWEFKWGKWEYSEF